MLRTADLTRRQLIGAGALGAAAAYGGGWADTLSAALAASPGGSKLEDIEHVVFLIQENRSFDHYFGSYRGVRGFGDRSPGGPFAQPGYPAAGFGGQLLPFHIDTSMGKGQCVPDPDHSWPTQHRSWNAGKLDSFVSAHLKSDGDAVAPITMGYYERGDLPFYYALADAFTLCDNYFSSVIGPSYPNQSYIISAWIDPDGKKGGPLLLDASPRQFSWTTMPEQLETKGISWKAYTTPDEVAPGQVGDPVFPYFDQYYANPALGQKALVPQYPSDFLSDCASGALPQVSWVYTSIAFSEHPPGPVEYGEATTQQVLNALVANPKLWAKTALFITWDENGGFFDHVIPPTPPPGTAGEELTVKPLPDAAAGIAGPIGLGFRVPMLVVSPFTRGGFVCSDTFDHTSMLRFLEARFGTEVPNLSAWRRGATGDLTGAFNFAAAADTSVPTLPVRSMSDPAVLAGDCGVQLAGKFTAPPASTPPPNSTPTQEPGTAKRPSGLPKAAKPHKPKHHKPKHHKPKHHKHHAKAPKRHGHPERG